MKEFQNSKKLKVAMWCMTQLLVEGHSACAGDVYTCSTAALEQALLWFDADDMPFINCD